MFTIHKFNILRLYLIVILFTLSTFPSEGSVILKKEENKLELVQDHNHFLTEKQDLKINKKLVLIDKKYTIKIYFIAIDSSQNSSTKKLINNKKLEAKNNKWVLILLSQNASKKNHTVSIKFSENLQGILSEELSLRIIDHEIHPNFKNGKYYRGIDAAVNVLNSIISEKYSAEKYLTRNKTKENRDKNKLSNWLIIIVILIVILLIINRIIKKEERDF